MDSIACSSLSFCGRQWNKDKQAVVAAQDRPLHGLSLLDWQQRKAPEALCGHCHLRSHAWLRA